MSEYFKFHMDVYIPSVDVLKLKHLLLFQILDTPARPLQFL
jgi:hypothetical protein